MSDQSPSPPENSKKPGESSTQSEADFWDLDDIDSSPEKKDDDLAPLPQVQIPSQARTNVRHIGGEGGSDPVPFGIDQTTLNAPAPKSAYIDYSNLAQDEPAEEETDQTHIVAEVPKELTPLEEEAPKAFTPRLEPDADVDKIEDFDDIEAPSSSRDNLSPKPRNSPAIKTFSYSEESSKVQTQNTEPAPPKDAEPASEAKPAKSEEIPSPEEPKATAGEKTKLTRLEKIFSSAVAVIVVGLLIWGVASMNSLIPDPPERLAMPDFPVEGKHVQISSAETYWRPPVLDGPNPDDGDSTNALIPVIQFTTSEESSSASLRILFIYRTEGDEYIQGDARNLTVEPGQTYRISGTKGFNQVGDLMKYAFDENLHWRVRIIEAPSGQVSREDYITLVDIPMSSDQLDSRRED